MLFAAGLPAAALGVPIGTSNAVLTLNLPDGFTELVPTQQVRPEILASFVLSGSAGNILLSVESLSARTNGSRSAGAWEQLMPLNVEVVGVYTEKWKTMDLDVVYARYRVGATDAVVHSVEVPLRPEPIRVSVEGPRSREPESKAVMQSVIRSLDSAPRVPDGSPEEPNPIPWVRSAWYLAMILAAALIGAASMTLRPGGRR
jgi:hypothetical protein